MSEEQTKEVSIPTKELLTILGIIQLVNSRGGFKPEEFVDVGAAYNKIYEFLVDLNVIQKTNSN
jgi:hypothetical protein